MSHESRHALGLLLVAGLIGGFALGAWAAGWGPFRRGPAPVPELGPDPAPPVVAGVPYAPVSMEKGPAIRRAFV